MEWHLAKVLNLLGIVLEFLSFWLAAPEILGEERLRAMEQGLERGIKLLPVPAALAAGTALAAWASGVPVAEVVLGEVVLVLAVGLMMLVVGLVMWGLQAEKAVPAVLVVLTMVLTGPVIAAVLQPFEEPEEALLVLTPLMLGVAVVMMTVAEGRRPGMPAVLALVLAVAVSEWITPEKGVAAVVLATVVAVAVGRAMAIMLQEKVVAPVLRVLADDARIRQRSLAVGAALFMIAFLCQFTAAILDISGP